MIPSHACMDGLMRCLADKKGDTATREKIWNDKSCALYFLADSIIDIFGHAVFLAPCLYADMLAPC